jgi:hypothetical protein
VKNDIKKWYQIKARYMNFDKPNGMVIKFWLLGNSDKHIRDMVAKKNYKDIEWIRQETPPFIGKL